MNEASSIVSALGATGLEFYAAASGQPIQATTVGGVTTTSIGSPLAGSSGSFVIIAIVAAIAVIAILLLK